MSCLQLDIKLKRRMANESCDMAQYETIHIIGMREYCNRFEKNVKPVNYKEWEYLIIADDSFETMLADDWETLSHHYEVLTYNGR